jgi:hypothetical protein
MTHEETKNLLKTAQGSKVVNALYTFPRAPFYRETKGLLHFESTLESKKYSQCEHVHECLSLPIYLQAYH